MNKLILKGQYFKHSTRKALTESEKREITDAADRSVNYLLRLMARRRDEDEQLRALRDRLLSLQQRSKYMSRLWAIHKGEIESMHLQKRSRLLEIATEAHKIADATGSEYSHVFSLLKDKMRAYLGNL